MYDVVLCVTLSLRVVNDAGNFPYDVELSVRVLNDTGNFPNDVVFSVRVVIAAVKCLMLLYSV